MSYNVLSKGRKRKKKQKKLPVEFGLALLLDPCINAADETETCCRLTQQRRKSRIPAMLASNWFGYEISGRDDNATSGGLCRVCGDNASGNHFGVLSCEACRSFFRRSVRVSNQYACRGARNCPVTAKTRNRCPFCRLQKCLAAGMRRQFQGKNV